MYRRIVSGVVAALFISACDDEMTAEEREALVSGHMETLRPDATSLKSFLRDMPKGADLHSHTSGAIATEKLIQWGAEDGACVNTSTYVASNPCAAGTTPLSNTTTDRALYNAVLSAWSMEGHPGPLLNAHQHFFDAFGKYGAVQLDSRNDDSYADIMSQAGKNKQIYIELMQGFGSGAGGSIAAGLFGPSDPWDAQTLLAKRQQIITTPSFTTAINNQKASIAATLSGARQLLGCGTASADPGCDVEVRMIVSANRTGSRAQVFGQWVYAYELAQVVPEIVGVNLVSPEEHPNSLTYYNDEMFALGTLDDFNNSQTGRKKVRVSLHAGELIPEVLTAATQDHLTYHIRNAVELAHAERIGHGVDVLGETAGGGAEDLLRDMAEKRVMVEICLTSNRVLLGASGSKHPLSKYLEYGVPVALSTDDQGILRGDITDEYVAAATDQGLDYKTLKSMARVSLEHAFVEGESLWAQSGHFNQPVSACAKQMLGAAQLSSDCQSFLDSNKRASLQWQLESQLASFEEGFVK
jgi:adenosine deaminase